MASANCLLSFLSHCSASTNQAEEYVPLPRGDVHKKKEIVQARIETRGEAQSNTPART